MTIHQAKGLEFDTVFVVGMSEGVMPNYRSIRDRKQDGLEEERRLAYVAVTRAENELYLTESEGYSHETGEKYPSRFIFEVQEGLLHVEGALPMDLIDATKRFIQKNDDEMLNGNDNSDSMSQFQIGDTVEHPSFGRGIIVEENLTENVYLIRFDSGIAFTSENDAIQDVFPISRTFKGLTVVLNS